MKKIAVSEPTYVPTTPETGIPLRLYDEWYVGFPQYSTDYTRELSLLQMIPTLKDDVLTKILQGDDWQEAFDSVLTGVGASPDKFEEVRRRVFISLPTEIQETINY